MLGVAHPECNRERRTSAKIPVLFHNLRGYDGHLLIKEINRQCTNVRLIARGMESYTAIQTKCFNFIGLSKTFPISKNIMQMYKYIKYFAGAGLHVFTLFLTQILFRFVSSLKGGVE